MTPPDPVQVVIYDAPTQGSQGCACGCRGHHHRPGEAQAPEEMVRMELQTRALALTFEGDFPQRVQVEYINAFQEPRGTRLPQTALLCSLTYPSPLVSSNGKGRFAGALPVERIRAAVEKILASG
jgi:hypothetical protein